MNSVEVFLSDTNTNPPVKVELRITPRRLPTTWGRVVNYVIIYTDTKFDEFLHVPTTGQTILTGQSTQSTLTDFSLRDSTRNHIRSLLRNQPHLQDPEWLCEALAAEISTAVDHIGFGRHSFSLTIHVTLRKQNIVVMSPPPPPPTPSNTEAVLRLVVCGRIAREDLKALKLDTEQCSICIDKLSSSKKLTRMTCSHVFHEQCLLEWFNRKNTCPLCRAVLYN